MIDLYKRIGIVFGSSDETIKLAIEKIRASDANLADRASAILMLPQRRRAYDRLWVSLTRIGEVRALAEDADREVVVAVGIEVAGQQVRGGGCGDIVDCGFDGQNKGGGRVSLCTWNVELGLAQLATGVNGEASARYRSGSGHQPALVNCGATQVLQAGQIEFETCFIVV